ncbi:MAG: hypothetical protein IJJ55_06115 [Clostridia bacterium]|nr:hypothetical protein [Clostridia bacterium]
MEVVALGHVVTAVIRTVTEAVRLPAEATVPAGAGVVVRVLAEQTVKARVQADFRVRYSSDMKR